MNFKALPIWAVVSIISISASVAASSVHFSVGQVCDSASAFEIQLPSKPGTLGELTVQVLNENQVQFQGDASGIRSISNSPIGDEALEILSDSQMRAYGWCVLVDGQQPDRMPDEIQITTSTRSIHWFYAFAFYDSGQWKSFCTPAHQVQPSQICPAKP